MTRTIMIVVVAAVLSACGGNPPPVLTLTDCPQPAAEALSAPELLPGVTTIPAEAADAINALSVTLERDEDVHGAEVDKREALIAHGVRFCGWTR